ncbi:MAG: leucine-rich repeat domain-containing protein, partial [Ureaplasma sp.]|nr:leucine-rich repeat domain-containing protein [Ureaplasma sp.]
NLKQNIQDLILNSKWTKDEFINKLTEDEFKTKISEFLNISVNSIDNITYNNDTLKITSNSMFEFTCNEPNTLIVDNNIILDNFTFYTAYELNNLENLYNAVNNYIALNNNKFTETEFVNNVSTTPDSIKKVIADNLKVTNSSGTQKIDISNIEDVQYLNNQLEITLTTDQFKYQLTPTEHVELIDNKLLIKNLNFFQLINVSLDELNNLRSKIIDFINSKKVTWFNILFYLSHGIFNLIKDVNTVDNHKLSEFVGTPIFGGNVIDIPLRDDIGLYKFSTKHNYNIDVTNDNITLIDFNLPVPIVPSSPENYFIWEGTKITKIHPLYTGVHDYILPAKTTEIADGVFKDNLGCSFVDMSRTKITKFPKSLFEHSSISTVIFPNNLVDLGIRTFYNCAELSFLNFPNSVTNMSGESLFRKTPHLKYIEFPKNVTGELGSNAFYESGIISITIPSGINTLGSHSFNSCNNLKTVNFMSGLTTIDDYAFHNTPLTEITLPDTITNISTYAFYGSNIKTVYVTSKDVENILRNVFSGTIINLNDKSKKLN